MLFLHGFLAWLTGHWWGSRFGAEWRERVEPGWGNRVFRSSAFLRLGYVILAVDGAAVVYIIASAGIAKFLSLVLPCMVAGAFTGLLLGREAY